MGCCGSATIEHFASRIPKVVLATFVYTQATLEAATILAASAHSALTYFMGAAAGGGARSSFQLTRSVTASAVGSTLLNEVAAVVVPSVRAAM